jgi:UTP--glucose-1-phosphate uridylyltransferase
MLPLVDRPVISYGVEEAIESGCTDIIMITGRTKRSIEDYFDSSYELESILRDRGRMDLYEKIRSISEMANILYVRLREPLGLGHAVLCGEPFCRDGYFGVILPDDVFVSDVAVLNQLIETHRRLGGTVVALEEVPRREVSRYGIVKSKVEGDGVHRILDMVEKPSVEDAPGNFAIMGRYILSPAIFPLLAERRMGMGGEIQLTDALKRLLEIEPVWGVVYRGRRFDCGTQKGWLAANIRLALEEAELNPVVLDIVDAFRRQADKVEGNK